MADGAPRSAVRKALAAVVLALFGLALLEGGARTLAVSLRPSVCFDVGACWSAWSRPDPTLAFYPKLRDALEPSAEPDETVHVLLLGGSVLHHDWSPIGSILADRLSLALRKRVRIDNLSDSSHTSRDSRFKYARLAARRYDLVVVYHGINEVKFNNVPPDVFRADYGHVAWYAEVNVALDDAWLPRLALPWAARYAGVLLDTRLGRRPLLPDRPPPAWLEAGLDVKTAPSFRDNLEAMAGLARSRGDPLVVATFAIHLPETYSPKAFRRLEDDYAQHIAPVKLWGLAEAVRTGVAAHNEEIRGLAARDPRVRLADADRSLPRRREYFNDVCHLTVAGAEAFARILLPAAREALETGRSR